MWISVDKCGQPRLRDGGKSSRFPQKPTEIHKNCPQRVERLEICREAGLDCCKLCANLLIHKNLLFHFLNGMKNASVISTPKKHANVLESYPKIFVEDKHSHVSGVN